MDDELLHFSVKPLTAVRDTTQDETPGPKPSGLWVSVGTAWPEWCLAEEFGVDRLVSVNRIVLAPNANILRLASPRDLDDFTGAYSTDARDSVSRYSIAWDRVAARYDGILIAPYVWERRMALLWYYGWDCASGCLWNARAVSSIETVDPAAILERAKESNDHE